MISADITFEIEKYRVSRIAKAGLWLVTTDDAVELGSLFWRAQELYESANPAFRMTPCALHDYIKWYCANVSETKDFSYYTDYEGYNLSSEAIDQSHQFTSYPDTNRYDVLFARITGQVRGAQNGKYYLIGARSQDNAVLEHEISHGMFHLLPKYREAATKLVESLPQKDEVFRLLREEGYGDHVLIDEAQAYLATGVTVEMNHLEPLRHPFMRLYASHRKKLIPTPKPNAPRTP